MATARDGEQTTNTLLTGRNCSGVSIQQAAPLSSSFPRCCLRFVFYLPGNKTPLPQPAAGAFESVGGKPQADVQGLIHPLLVGGGDLPGSFPQAVFVQRADLL